MGVTAIEQVIRSCTSQTCQMRTLWVEKVRRAQTMVSTWLEEQDQEPEPQECLFLLGAALCGGWDRCKGSPANFAKCVYFLAFDPHFATTEGWLFSQEELAQWPESDGWKISGRLLGQNDARHILRLFPDIVAAIETEDVSNYANPFPQPGSLRVVRASQQGDERGTVTIAHVHRDGLLESLCTHVMTRGKYKDLGFLGEVRAGRILRAALVGHTGLELGEVRKLEGEYPDLEIEGYPWQIEHTKADSRPWRDLGKKTLGPRWYSVRESRAAQFDEFDRRVAAKAGGYPGVDLSAWVLLLDSGLLRLEPETIVQYGQERKATLMASGFRAVWYACVHSGKAFCLCESEP